jgi:hypothetical protein
MMLRDVVRRSEPAVAAYPLVSMPGSTSQRRRQNNARLAGIGCRSDAGAPRLAVTGVQHYVLQVTVCNMEACLEG